MKKFCSYLRADLKRLLCSAKIIISVALTVGVLLLATLEGIDFHAGVLYVFSLVMYGMPAMMILICGALAFANILHFRLEWVGLSGQQHYDSLLRAGGLRIFLKNREFEWYFLCYGLQYGLLSGILSLWASYLSLYISNRMLVLATPAILYYFTDYILAGIFSGRVSAGLVFSASYNLFSDDLLSVLFAAAVTVVNFVLVWVLMTWKIKK